MLKQFKLAEDILLGNRNSITEGYQEQVYSLLKDKPFWIWNKTEHREEYIKTNGQCCFNDIVGRPLKNGKEYPLFDYEKLLYDSLLSMEGNFKDKHLWAKKATGLGITEFMLRVMAWLCTSNNRIGKSQMCIVTGPNIDIATKLIKRLKGIFDTKLGLTFDNKETVLELNGCRIEAYPSNHIDSFRALDNPKFILLDESDFWRKSEIDNVRHVSERYIGKSDPYLVMISTPNAPGGLFYQIEAESEETCLYKRLKMDYHYGLGKIYTQEEIDKARQSPGFAREYELQYLGKIGNLLSMKVIDDAIKLGESLKNIPVNPYCIHSLGVDPGFGSSASGLVLTEHLKEEDKIRVLDAQLFDGHPNPNDIINTIFDYHRKYHNLWIFVDAAARGFITSLKIAFNENPDYERVEDVSPQSNKVIPVAFNKDHKEMISHMAMLFNQNHIAVPEEFDKLIISLKTCTVNEYTLDKEATSYDDLLDALRLSLKAYKII